MTTLHLGHECFTVLRLSRQAGRQTQSQQPRRQRQAVRKMVSLLMVDTVTVSIILLQEGQIRCSGR